MKRGEFVCIIGDVACGKSSLLSSIIGDMLYLSPEIVKKVSEPNLDPSELDKIAR